MQTSVEFIDAGAETHSPQASKAASCVSSPTQAAYHQHSCKGVRRFEAIRIKISIPKSAIKRDSIGEQSGTVSGSSGRGATLT